MSQANQIQEIQSAGLSPVSIHRISQIRKVVLTLPLIGLGLQIALANSSDDILCSFLAACGSFIVLFDCFRAQRFYRYPLSNLVVLGFVVTLQLGPLLFTAIEGRTITFNLAIPVTTFIHSLITGIICISAHYVYRGNKWLKGLKLMLQQFLAKLRIFEPLRLFEVLLMGSLGTFSLAITSWLSNLSEGAFTTQIIQGFSFLSIIPAAYALQGLTNTLKNINLNQRNRFLIYVAFLAIITILSIGRNARSPFVVPVACFTIGLAMEWIYGLIRIKIKTFITILLILLLVFPFFTDLATAIVMSRTFRANVETTELFSKTIALMQDRESIRQYRIAASELEMNRDWSENYVSNLFLSRFSNAKFPDNSLENSSRLGQAGRDEMVTIQAWKLLTFLPGPILSMISVPISIKEEINSSSFGDKLYSLATGDQNAIGGFRTGHFFGTGMAGFGYYYLIILFISLLIVFPFVDSHAVATGVRSGYSPIFSAVAITQLIRWFTLSNSESLSRLITFPTREFFEPVILFFLIRYILRGIKLG